MNWLVFVFALEAGILPNYHFAMYEPNPVYVIAEHSLYTDLEASIELYGFYVGGGMKCFFWKTKGGYSFHPYQMSYRFEAGWRNNWLTIGFRHHCMHPVMPWTFSLPEKNWEGAYEELYIRVHGRINLGRSK